MSIFFFTKLQHLIKIKLQSKISDFLHRKTQYQIKKKLNIYSRSLEVCRYLTNPPFWCPETWLGWWTGLEVGSVVFLKSSSMSKTLLSRDLEEVSFMSSSFILFAIMIVFLVIFSPGLKWSRKWNLHGLILNSDWCSINKGSNVLPKHKQAVNNNNNKQLQLLPPTWTCGAARAATAGTRPPPSQASRGCPPAGGDSWGWGWWWCSWSWPWTWCSWSTFLPTNKNECPV